MSDKNEILSNISLVCPLPKITFCPTNLPFARKNCNLVGNVRSLSQCPGQWEKSASSFSPFFGCYIGRCWPLLNF
jgi:hypothetical protein